MNRNSFTRFKDRLFPSQVPQPSAMPCILINPKQDRLIQIGDYRKLYNTLCAAPALGVGDASTLCLVTMDSFSNAEREAVIDLLRFSRPGDGMVRSFYDALMHMHPSENIQSWIKAHQELGCEQQEEQEPEL